MATWTVLAVTKVVDGDTVRLTRQRPIALVDELIIIARDATPVSVRLIHVDTPERGEVGWAQARADLEMWVGAHPGGLTLEVAGRDNFGRILGDLRAPDGDTASLHMVRDRHWPVWMETR